jgi:hypothetical protein
MVQTAHGPNDRLVFVTSSHGSGDGRGESFLCLLPDPVVGVTPDERSGSYFDHDLATDLSGGGQNQSRTFVFIDACFSGGLIEELLDALPHVVGTTTCTRKGYGYDNAATHSGAWTNGFLTQGLRRRPPGEDVDLAALYVAARDVYARQYANKGDRPCFFGRTTGVRPCNTDDPAHAQDQLPLRAFMSREWLA